MKASLTNAVPLPTDQDATGRKLGDEELANLGEVIASGVLNSTKGTFVKRLEASFAQRLGVKHVYACSSGTAAIHAAIAAINPEPGDEVVTSPITDIGALTPILYQGAIPVFADVDSRTWNCTSSSIEAALSERTRAIIVTHLFGNPCNMDSILPLAESRGIPVIEDCAQAYLAKHHQRLVGTLGTIGCFSLQQGKHITSGEGGLIATSNDDLARRIRLFINKGWPYGEQNPDHEFLALNSRMTELQGAVAAAQLPRLQQIVDARIVTANKLTDRLADLPAILTPHVTPGNVHAYWKYCLRVNGDMVRGGCDALGKQLKVHNIACAPRYIQKPAFECKIFREQKTFGNSRFPFTLARPEALDYGRSRFPQTYGALQNLLVLPWNENYEDEHVDFISEAIHEAVHDLGC